MTLDQSDLTELLDALRAGGGIDVVRKGVELVLQALIDTEAEATIGARHYERNDTRTAWRNGTRDRTLSTKAGDVELKIPKLRSGSFFPQVLERRRRIDRATYAVVMEAYVHGVSTRKVDDLVQALGLESGISKSEVSRICAGLDEELTGFRERSLAHVEFPYVFLDATYVKGRVNHQVVSRAVVVATGQAPNLAELTRAWSVPTRVSRSLHTIPCIYLGSSALTANEQVDDSLLAGQTRCTARDMLRALSLGLAIPLTRCSVHRLRADSLERRNATSSFAFSVQLGAARSYQDRDMT